MRYCLLTLLSGTQLVTLLLLSHTYIYVAFFYKRAKQQHAKGIFLVMIILIIHKFLFKKKKILVLKKN